MLPFSHSPGTSPDGHDFSNITENGIRMARVKQKLHPYSTPWAQQAPFLAPACFPACLLPNPVPWCHGSSSRSEEPNSLCHQPFFCRVILKNKTKFVHLVSYGARWHLHPLHWRKNTGSWKAQSCLHTKNPLQQNKPNPTKPGVFSVLSSFAANEWKIKKSSFIVSEYFQIEAQVWLGCLMKHQWA